jgi:uncharacterized membrane protein
MRRFARIFTARPRLCAGLITGLVAAVHGLLSFLFNTIILALTVNLAAGLL